MCILVEGMTKIFSYGKKDVISWSPSKMREDLTVLPNTRLLWNDFIIITHVHPHRRWWIVFVPSLVKIHRTIFKVYGYTTSFSAMFSKGDNFGDFLFAYLRDEVFPKWGQLLKEWICSDGSKFFPFWDDPIHIGGNNENDRIASPEIVPIHLD